MFIYLSICLFRRGVWVSVGSRESPCTPQALLMSYSGAPVGGRDRGWRGKGGVRRGMIVEIKEGSALRSAFIRNTYYLLYTWSTTHLQIMVIYLSFSNTYLFVSRKFYKVKRIQNMLRNYKLRNIYWEGKNTYTSFYTWKPSAHNSLLSSIYFFH